MFGIMDNNMGFHKERSALRPQTNHPEIKTDGSMLDFTLSSVHSLSSRSILVLIRGVFSTLSDFTIRLTSTTTHSNNLLNSFVSSNTNDITHNISLFVVLCFNLFKNMLNTAVYF